MAGSRKRYSPQEKAQIVLELLKGEQTQSQITAKYGVHSAQLQAWKKQALAGITDSLSDKRKRETQDKTQLVDGLYKQIDKLKVELDWLKKIWMDQ